MNPISWFDNAQGQYRGQRRDSSVSAAVYRMLKKEKNQFVLLSKTQTFIGEALQGGFWERGELGKIF